MKAKYPHNMSIYVSEDTREELEAIKEELEFVADAELNRFLIRQGIKRLREKGVIA